MQIIKYGHSCILLDDGITKILFDPGKYSDIPDLSVNSIIITHIHSDHYDIEKLQKLLANGSPKIITNSEVKAELEKNGITGAEVVEDGQSTDINGVTVSAHGNDHAIIHPDLPKFQNTGYLVAEKVFHPGDALFVPSEEVEVLLLPVVAPWSKISETLDYVTAVKAKTIFPIHDAFLKFTGNFYKLAEQWTEKYNGQFIKPELNKTYEL